MRQSDYLSLQANIICILLALAGSTAIIKHPDWFGGAPGIINQVDSAAARVAQP